MWPLSIALVSTLSFSSTFPFEKKTFPPAPYVKQKLGSKEVTLVLYYFLTSFATWKFPRIFHCTVAQETLGIANSCLDGSPVRYRKHICIPQYNCSWYMVGDGSFTTVLQIKYVPLLYFQVHLFISLYHKYVSKNISEKEPMLK